MKAAFTVITLIFGLVSPAAAQSKPVLIEKPWVRIFNGETSAYFTILNNSEEPDRLLGVSSPVASSAELYRTRIRAGKFTYLPLGGLAITGYDDERLHPGGNFIRLTGLKRELHVGQPVPLILHFERSGSIEVMARVGNQLLGNR